MNENKSFEEIKQALSKALSIDKRIHGPDENGHLWIRCHTGVGLIKITFDEKDRRRIEDLLGTLPECRLEGTWGGEETRPKPENEQG